MPAITKPAKRRWIKFSRAPIKTAFSDKTERTAFIAAWAQLQKTNEQYSQFQRIRLVEPLAQNLALKTGLTKLCEPIHPGGG